MSKKVFIKKKKEILKKATEFLSEYLDKQYESYGDKCEIDLTLCAGDDEITINKSEDSGFEDLRYDTL